MGLVSTSLLPVLPGLQPIIINLVVLNNPPPISLGII